MTSQPALSADRYLQYDPDGSHWWITCPANGGTHYGEHGAAGVLLGHVADDGTARVLLHQRAPGTDHAGTWAYPGGAIAADETRVLAAVRELAEEASIALLGGDLRIAHEHDCACGWTYTTFTANVHDFDGTNTRPEPVGNWEAGEWRWVTEDEAFAMPLLPAAIPAITAVLRS